MRVALLGGGLMLALVACDRGAPSTRPTWPSTHPPCPAPAAAARGWTHARSELVARLGDPRHVASDVVIAAGQVPTVVGKFSYGRVSKDLEDEEVELQVLAGSGCAITATITARSDDDGQARATPPALAAGYHRYRFWVRGDATAAEGGIWVVPRATPAVVFDVDGTLTTSDGELLDELLGEAAEAFPGAAEVARRWAERGYLIVYLTGRPTPLRARTQRWLDRRGFPYGPLFTPTELGAALPTHGGVGAYKRDTLRALIDAGVVVTRAYGNAATDVCAYAEAGIAPAQTWIVGTPTPCGAAAPPRSLGSYLDHLAEVEGAPPAR